MVLRHFEFKNNLNDATDRSTLHKMAARSPYLILYDFPLHVIKNYKFSRNPLIYIPCKRFLSPPSENLEL